LESSGSAFSKALIRAGLHVVAVPDAYSRIRGGHNFMTIRANREPVYAAAEGIQVLIALNAETIQRHLNTMVPGSALICDAGLEFDRSVLDGRDIRLVDAPLLEIARTEGNELMINTASVAVAAGLTGFDIKYILSVISEGFDRQGTDIAKANYHVAEAAYKWAAENHPGFGWQLKAIEGPKRVTINANQAFAMGALMAGCKFVADYPMTPTTPVLE